MAPALLLCRLRALVTSCCFFGSPPPALEDDDILGEILLRLPPRPSSFLRASAVCKRWRGVLSDPHFRRRFRARHRTPPLLGVFNGPVFTPLLPVPDRIPRERFSLPQPRRGRLIPCDARHGLVVLLNHHQFEAVVWDPVTGFRQTVPYAPEFRAGRGIFGNQAAVLRTTGAADDDGGGGGFRVVLTRTESSSDGHTMSVFMAAYESATGKWSQASSAIIPSFNSFLPNSILVGNALCGFFHWPAGVLAFDLDTNAVGVIKKPRSIYSDHLFCYVVRTQDGGLGLAKLRTTPTSIRLWGRTNNGAAAEWVLHKEIDLGNMVSELLPTAATSLSESDVPRIVGYDEDNNEIHVVVNDRVFTVNLGTLECTLTVLDGLRIFFYYPYTSFYTSVARSKVFECQDEEIAPWCSFFSRCKRTM